MLLLVVIMGEPVSSLLDDVSWAGKLFGFGSGLEGAVSFADLCFINLG